jgi:hypothetical protein
LRNRAYVERELPTNLGEVSRMDSGGTPQIGDRVRFRVSDVFLPEPAEVLANLTPDVEANGVVVEFSDSGSSPRVYAVVRITAQQSVLLPVGSLRVLGCE